MPLADVQSDTVHSKTSEADVLALKARYDAGDHEALVDYPAEAALMYQIQLMKEDIDELRRYLTAEVGSGAAGRDGTNGTNGTNGTTPTMTSLRGSSLPTRAPARGLLWNDRGTVKIG